MNISYAVWAKKTVNNIDLEQHRNRIPKKQTKIKSDLIDIKQKSKKIDFIKNAIVETEDTTLKADKITVYYFDKNEIKTDNSNLTNSKSKIKEIKAEGRVKMINNEYNASSDFAFYEPHNDVFILEKNVFVNNGTSVLNGERFVYDLITKKGQIFGKNKNLNNKLNNNSSKSKDRVTVIIGNDLNE